jgi:hypothetical protein
MIKCIISLHLLVSLPFQEYHLLFAPHLKNLREILHLGALKIDYFLIISCHRNFPKTHELAQIDELHYRILSSLNRIFTYSSIRDQSHLDLALRVFAQLNRHYF